MPDHGRELAIPFVVRRNGRDRRSGSGNGTGNCTGRGPDDSLEAIAESALQRQIGARGLRMIIEDLMLDLMYTLPGQKKVRECVITREVVQSKEKPITLIEKAG